MRRVRPISRQRLPWVRAQASPEAQALADRRGRDHVGHHAGHQHQADALKHEAQRERAERRDQADHLAGREVGGLGIQGEVEAEGEHGGEEHRDRHRDRGDQHGRAHRRLRVEPDHLQRRVVDVAQRQRAQGQGAGLVGRTQERRDRGRGRTARRAGVRRSGVVEGREAEASRRRPPRMAREGRSRAPPLWWPGWWAWRWGARRREGLVPGHRASPSISPRRGPEVWRPSCHRGPAGHWGPSDLAWATDSAKLFRLLRRVPGCAAH